MPSETDYVVGEMDLSQSSKLVFSVRPWKGRRLAHVRKFVSRPNYEGPTKAGLAMGSELLRAVIGALTRLNEEVPGVEERLFAELPKGRDTNIAVTVIPPDDLRALPSVDVREHVDSARYKGPTKKGVRCSWDKLPEFIGILELQAQRLKEANESWSLPFTKGSPKPARQPETVGTGHRQTSDSILHELLPKGLKDFPSEFLDAETTVKLQLPPEPVSAVILPGGTHAVQSAFGFRHDVRNATEGNFIIYAYLRGHREVEIPVGMIDIFRAVKGYENYVRGLQRALLHAYERKSGHRPMAEHKARDFFESRGLPWLD